MNSLFNQVGRHRPACLPGRWPCLVAFSLAIAVPAGAVPAKGHRVMISGPSPYAVEIGREIAQKGGNAVDVAVAAALSLAVTHPYFASLGGGGFALIKTDAGGIEALDFRETAPKGAGPDFYRGKGRDASITGALAVGVPGLPAGLYELQKKRGKLHWSRLFPHVIELAAKGFPVSGEWVEITERQAKRFNAAGRRIFRKPSGSLVPGEILRQPELAKLLREMSVRNIVPFYQGLPARDIVETLRAAGGALSIEDLQAYKPRWLAPLKLNYRGFEVWSMPPPSSGGVVSQAALKLLELLPGGDAKPLSVAEFHRLGEALKLAFRGRSKLGDPDFVKNPVETLLGDSFLQEEAKLFNPLASIDIGPLIDVKSDSEPPAERGETTHISVMTSEGEGVAMTVTLNGSYGSGMVTEKFGIALNDEMDDFLARPGKPNMYGLIQGEPNAVEGGKRPLSSMSPTIVTEGGAIRLVLGAPGGPRIISAVTQVLYRALSRPNLDVDAIVQAPRVHHQFQPDVLYVDRNRFAPETLDGLRARGHVIEEGSTAKAYLIRLDPGGLLEGAFDSRGEGAAGGI